MSKHTPGPWSVERTSIVHRKPNGAIRSVAETYWADDEAQANARLIAAAPELHEALRELVALVRGECPSLLNEDSGGDARLSMEIDAALAKASASSEDAKP